MHPTHASYSPSPLASPFLRLSPTRLTAARVQRSCCVLADMPQQHCVSPLIASAPHLPLPLSSLQALSPQMVENRKRAEELLREAATLSACLDARTQPGLLERLLPKRAKQYQKGISQKA